MIVGVRLSFPNGTVIEFTYDEDCDGTPDEWVIMHQRKAEKASVERFESEIPVNRMTWPDGRVTDYIQEERGRASSA